MECLGIVLLRKTICFGIAHHYTLEEIYSGTSKQLQCGRLGNRLPKVVVLLFVFVGS